MNASPRRRSRRSSGLGGALGSQGTPAKMALLLAAVFGFSDARAHLVPLVVPEADTARESFVRVVNHSGAAGSVRIEAIDDDGRRHGPVSLSIDGHSVVHLNSTDLERGNSGKGLPSGLGAAAGDRRLELASDLDVSVLTYMRTEDGFLTAMGDLAPEVGGTHEVAIFNPASNRNQVSRLRLINFDSAPAAVDIAGVDDRGESPGTTVRLSIPASGGRTLTALELESGDGDGLSGELGDGTGKWRLAVDSDSRIAVMSLLLSPAGHLTNLSSAPESERATADGGHRHPVPLFPAAGDANREGFVRVINRSNRAGTVRIRATDETGETRGPVTLAIDANAVAPFNSSDLEQGKADKGLSGGVGAGSGDWRLELASALDLKVLAYMRTEGGFLTSIHDVAAHRGNRFHIATFNPGSNENQISRLRLDNPAGDSVVVRIAGIDDQGASPGLGVRVVVPAHGVRMLGARELESGEIASSTGSLGDGSGKWRLAVEADAPIRAMRLLESPSGHLTNLSANLPSVAAGSAVTVSGAVEELDDGGAPATCTLYAVAGERVLARTRTDAEGAFALYAPPERPAFLGCAVRGLPALELEAFLDARAGGTAVSELAVSPRSTVLALLLSNELADDPDIDISARFDQLASDLPGTTDGELLVETARVLLAELRDRALDVPVSRLLIDVFVNGRVDDPQLASVAEALDAAVAVAEAAAGVRVFRAAHRTFADLALAAEQHGLDDAPPPPLAADPGDLADLADGFKSDEFARNPSLDSMNAHWAYARGLTGDGEVTGMTDTGIYAIHEEFAGQLHGETLYTIIADDANGDGVPEVTLGKVEDEAPSGAYPEEVAPEPNPDCRGILCKFYLYSHGTLMASLAVGARDSVDAHGLAYGARLLFWPIRQNGLIGERRYHRPDGSDADWVTRHDLVMQVGDMAPIVSNSWLSGDSRLAVYTTENDPFPFHEVLPKDWRGYQRDRDPDARTLLLWSTANVPMPEGPWSDAAALPSVTERQVRAASEGAKGLADFILTEEERRGLSDRQARLLAEDLLRRLKRRWLAVAALADHIDAEVGDARAEEEHLARRVDCAGRASGSSGCSFEYTLGASARCGFASDWCIAAGTMWGGVLTDYKEPPETTGHYAADAYRTSEAAAAASGALTVLLQAYRDAGSGLTVGTSTVLERLKRTANPDVFDADAQHDLDGSNLLRLEEATIRALVGFAGASDDELRALITDARAELAGLLPRIPDRELDKEETPARFRTTFSGPQRVQIRAAKDSLDDAQWRRFRVLTRLIAQSAYWREIDTFPPYLKRVRALLRQADRSRAGADDLLARLIRQVEWIDEQLRRMRKSPDTVTHEDVRRLAVTSLVGHGFIDLKAATDPER